MAKEWETGDQGEPHQRTCSRFLELEIQSTGSVEAGTSEARPTNPRGFRNLIALDPPSQVGNNVAES